MGVTWDFDQIKDDIDKEINEKINQFLTECYNNLVALSPVDTGRYRNAHHFSINAPSYAENGVTSIRIPVGDYPTVYLQNNLPYASIIEHGGYPNPVKYGTWRKGVGRGKGGKKKGYYEVRSVGGYSYQAPQGVYQVAFESAIASLG